jgi:Phosphotransferase enzyme family
VAVEQPLTGGAQTPGLVRVGDTVRRPPHARSAFVHALLEHLAAVGFPGAPRVLGRDHQGRSVLTFVPGDVPHALPAQLSDARLRSATALVRAFHDATTTFPLLAGQEVVCHGDLGPHNTVFRGETAVALIDWDEGVAPGRRVVDVAHAVWCFADVTEAEVPVEEQARRVRLMCDAYPGITPDDVVAELAARFARARDQHAAARRPGGVAVFERLLRWLDDNRARLTGADQVA